MDSEEVQVESEVAQAESEVVQAESEVNPVEVFNSEINSELIGFWM